MPRHRAILMVAGGLLAIMLLFATSAQPVAAGKKLTECCPLPGHDKLENYGLEVTAEPSSTGVTLSWVLSENKLPLCVATAYYVGVGPNKPWPNYHTASMSYRITVYEPHIEAINGWKLTVGGLQPGHYYKVAIIGYSTPWYCSFHRLQIFTAELTATPLPTATHTPLPTITPEPIGPVGQVVETAGDPTGPELHVELPATPHVTTEKLPPFKVRNLAVTPAGTSATVTWKKVGTGEKHSRRCRTADPPQYRYKVVLWTGAVGDRTDREEVVEHTRTKARVAEITGLTSGTQYAALVQAYSAECDNWAKPQRVIWTQP